MCVYEDVCACVCVGMYILVCVHILYVYVDICVCMFVYMCICVCIVYVQDVGLVGGMVSAAGGLVGCTGTHCYPFMTVGAWCVQEQEMEEYQEEQHREAARQSIVEQERQRLLREHAAKLLGYLPRVSPHLCQPLRD